MTTPETLDPLPRLLDVLARSCRFGTSWRIGPSATLNDDLGFDSLARHSAAIDLEEAFGIEIPDAAMLDWLTVADVAATVARLTDTNPQHLFPFQPTQQGESA